MDLEPVRKRLPFALALMFFLLSFGFPAQRGVWIALGVVFLVIGLRRKKVVPPPSGAV